MHEGAGLGLADGVDTSVRILCTRTRKLVGKEEGGKKLVGGRPIGRCT